MFISPGFRMNIIDWPFFAVSIGLTMSSILASFILGVACVLNFGKGLRLYRKSLDLVNMIVDD